MSRFFSRIALTIVLVAVAHVAFAQEEHSDIIRPITKQGSAAFLFTIQGLGTFGVGAPPITAGPSAEDLLFGAGMKYYIVDDWALRILLAFNSFGKDTTNFNLPGSTVQMRQTVFGIGAGVEYHFRPLYSISPYLGAVASYAGTNTDNGQSNPFLFRTSSHTFGVLALAGFDWFFTHGMAAGAEYAFGFATTSSDQTQNVAGGGTITTDLGNTNEVGFAGVGNVHLVVYF